MSGSVYHGSYYLLGPKVACGSSFVVCWMRRGLTGLFDGSTLPLSLIAPCLWHLRGYYESGRQCLTRGDMASPMSWRTFWLCVYALGP